MQHHRQLACQRHLGLAHTGPLGHAQRPGFQPSAFDRTLQNDVGRFVKRGAYPWRRRSWKSARSCRSRRIVGTSYSLTKIFLGAGGAPSMQTFIRYAATKRDHAYQHPQSWGADRTFSRQTCAIPKTVSPPACSSVTPCSQPSRPLRAACGGGLAASLDRCCTRRI